MHSKLHYYKKRKSIQTRWGALQNLRRLIIVGLILFCNTAEAKRLNPESYYQYNWCKDKGITEYVLSDGTRVDCLTSTEAIEFDFANKWAECVGQSLYYGLMTNKTPACALIIEKESDLKYLDRLKPIADKHAIKVYIVN
jgi:hypothetical protein